MMSNAETESTVRGPVALDPTRTGRDAESLDANLRRLVVGQPEAIEQIVNIYQMHQGDSIHVAIRHDMKREILPGVSDIGIKISKIQ